jgi:glycosyltransferase
VQEQTYTEVEHIIIDGASSDNTLEIVNSFPHVKIVRTEPDTGIYDGMNKGIRLASGDVIGFLNSDDFYPNNQILSKVAKVFARSDIDSCYGDLQYVSKFDPSTIVRNWNSGPFDRNKFITGWMPPHPTFFVKRKVYENYGLFDLDLRSSADYELMLRFLYKHRISTHYISETLVKMRMGGQSNATISNRLKANSEDKLAWTKNGLKPKFYTTWLKPIRKIIQYKFF